jgi:hypothetical protein
MWPERRLDRRPHEMATFRAPRSAEHGTRHLCAKCQDHGASLQSVAPHPSAAPNWPACRLPVRALRCRLHRGIGPDPTDRFGATSSELQTSRMGRYMPDCAPGSPPKTCRWKWGAWKQTVVTERTRPVPAHRRAPKLPDDRLGSFAFHVCEAAVRGLRRSANCSRSRATHFGALI